MSSDATPDHALDGYLQRAQLLAELGRYEEAEAEVGYAVALDPANPAALTLLARVRLAAERPVDALAAADSALAASPAQAGPLVLRGLALLDLRRFAEAAAVADDLLGRGGDAYAQRSGAAILAGARNGQRALNAAWRGVELAPEEPQAHLVLALVAARLELFDLSERAYREALRLDPDLAEARHDPGVIRLERRRYAEALEHLAELAAPHPGRIDAPRAVSTELRRLVLYGAGYSLVVAVLAAFLATAEPVSSRLFAVLTALAGAVLAWRFATRVPGLVGTVLPGLMRTDRALALAVYAVGVAPVLLLVYAAVGSPWPLALAVAATAVAELAVLVRPVAR